MGKRQMETSKLGHCARLFSRVVALSIVTLAACSPPAQPLKPLSDLHLKDVTQIPGIAALHAPPKHGVIESVATYQSDDGASTQRVLFALDGEMYDVALNGAGLRPLGMTCTGSVTVSQNNMLMACQDDGNIVITKLTPGLADSSREVIVNEKGDPAWLPDSSHLAVVESVNGQCAIAIFARSPASEHFQLSARLILAQFSASNGCGIFGPVWSSDGSWLAFVAVGGPSHVYAVSTATLLPEILHAPPLLTIRVPSGLLVQLGTTTVITPPTWSNRESTLTLTFSGPDWSHITQVDPVTRQQRTLLSIPEGRVDAVSWGTDNRSLAFAQGQPACLECGSSFTPSHLYVYTPDT